MRERPFSDAVPFYGVWFDHNQRGAARARRRLACCASNPETASTDDAPAPRLTRSAGLALDAATDTSHRSRAPKETGMSPVWCITMAHALTTYLRGAARAQEPCVLRLPRNREHKPAGSPAPREAHGARFTLEDYS